jgi:hypothetical protein
MQVVVAVVLLYLLEQRLLRLELVAHRAVLTLVRAAHWL